VSKVVPGEIFREFEFESLGTVKQKVGDAPEMQKLVAKRRRQCSLLRCQTQKCPVLTDAQQLTQVAVKEWSVDEL